MGLVWKTGYGTYLKNVNLKDLSLKSHFCQVLIKSGRFFIHISTCERLIEACLLVVFKQHCSQSIPQPTSLHAHQPAHDNQGSYEADDYYTDKLPHEQPF